MSPGMREILAWNPLLHAINLFRQGFYYNYPSLLLDTHYLAVCTIVFVLFGLLFERVTRRSESA
jgi:capsular polysaccharide transport system permease protein